MNGTNTVSYSPTTGDNLLIDSGRLYRDYGLATECAISATSTGNEFDIITKFRDVKVDGLKSVQKGLRLIESVEVNLKVNLLEFTTQTLTMALMGTVDSITDPNYDIIKGKTYIGKITRDMESLQRMVHFQRFSDSDRSLASDPVD